MPIDPGSNKKQLSSYVRQEIDFLNEMGEVAEKGKKHQRWCLLIYREDQAILQQKVNQLQKKWGKSVLVLGACDWLICQNMIRKYHIDVLLSQNTLVANPQDKRAMVMQGLNLCISLQASLAFKDWMGQDENAVDMLKTLLDLSC